MAEEPLSPIFSPLSPPKANDPAPSNVHILAGDFVGNYAGLDADHGAAISNDFSTVAGKVLIATPTTFANTADNNQVIGS